VRRRWFDLYEAHAAPLAREALDRIGQLYKIETAIRGQSAEKRRAARQKYAVPLLAALHAWMIEQAAKVDQGSTFATAFNYAFNNCDALQRYLHYVLERIADHPINRIEELLPWNLIDQLQQPTQVTHALAA